MNTHITDEEIVQAAYAAYADGGSYILISDIYHNLGIGRHQRREYNKRHEIVSSQKVNAVIRSAGFVSVTRRGKRAHYVYMGDVQ